MSEWEVYLAWFLWGFICGIIARRGLKEGYWSWKP